MPIMNGYQACEAIRLMPNGKTIPIIAMTANVMSEQRMLARNAGMNDFIYKPIIAHTMFKTIQKRINTANIGTPKKMTESKSTTPFDLYGIDTSFGLELLQNNTTLYRRLLLKLRDRLETFKSRTLSPAAVAQEPIALGSRWRMAARPLRSPPRVPFASSACTAIPAACSRECRQTTAAGVRANQSTRSPHLQLVQRPHLCAVMP